MATFVENYIFWNMPKKSMHHSAKPSTFKNAYRLRTDLTPAELMLWEHLKSKQLGGYKFRSQHPITRYILDFYCHEVKLAIELDGSVHDSKDAKFYDDDRDNNLSELGVHTIRFRNENVLEDIENVKRKILQKIAEIKLNR
jgi:very-short-patch-repair endonuclease